MYKSASTHEQEEDGQLMTQEAYQNKIETKLEKSRAEIKKLKARTGEATGKARPDYEKAVDKIAAALKTAEQKFQEVKQAGGAGRIQSNLPDGQKDWLTRKWFGQKAGLRNTIKIKRKSESSENQSIAN